MTYAPLPVHQPTFIALTAAGVLALVVAAALALLQPHEVAGLVADAATIDVSVTGALARECVEQVSR